MPTTLLLTPHPPGFWDLPTAMLWSYSFAARNCCNNWTVSCHLLSSHNVSFPKYYSVLSPFKSKTVFCIIFHYFSPFHSKLDFYALIWWRKLPFKVDFSFGHILVHLRKNITFRKNYYGNIYIFISIGQNWTKFHFKTTKLWLKTIFD